MTLNELMNKNSKYFAPGNKKFFGDLSYQIEESASGKFYLHTRTRKWTKEIFSILKEIREDGKLEIDSCFETSGSNYNREIKKFLEEK